MGKTFVLALAAVHVLDAVGAVIDPETDACQGARVLLPGPSHSTVFATIYSQMLAHANRAESRGHEMPGRRSENSVLWRVEPMYEVEAFSPSKSVGEKVAHTASGRHHKIQHAFIEEGQGVGETVWAAVEGMCASDGNKIISSFNPTEARGPAYARGRRGDYVVYHLDAFDFPNVRGRSNQVSAALDYKVIDSRVRAQCRDRGDYPAVFPDPTFGDFIYALPQPAIEREWHDARPERGAREDGHLGHPDAELRVFRPSGTFEAQVRGEWPRSGDGGLFSQAAWDAAVERWKRAPDPMVRPSRIGLDAAREGDDDCCYAPAWGADAAELLRAWALAEQDQDVALLEAIKEQRRATVGEIRVAPKGDGPDVARHIAREFGDVPWNVDAGGVGASVFDHANKVLGIEACSVSFGGAPPEEKLPEEPYALNIRALLYIRAARLVAMGLVDVPDDPLLREEVLAHEVRRKTRAGGEDGGDITRTVTVTETDGRIVRRAMPVVRILEKDEIKRRIGRSPDRADAFVLALWPVTRGFELMIGRARA